MKNFTRRGVNRVEKKVAKKILCLTFQLDDELFALDVVRVREVLDYQDVSHVPGMPGFMLGVINVRDRVVPVMDLRLKFGMSVTGATADTRVVVMEIDDNGSKIVIGALADAVHDVVEFDVDSIEPPPGSGIGWRNDYISGIGKRDDQFYIILDTTKVYSGEELTEVAKTAMEDQSDEKEIDPDNNSSDSLKQKV